MKSDITKVTSSCHIKMPPEHRWFTHHVCCFKKAWNRKNVLENILVKL